MSLQSILRGTEELEELIGKGFDKEGRLSENARDAATVLEGGKRLVLTLEKMSKRRDDKKKRGE